MPRWFLCPDEYGSSSIKQKIPSKSSTKSELIGLYDKSGDILWTCHFLEAQGYTISANIVFQDNMSKLSLAKNGYVSSSKRTKHIKAKYLYVWHYHNSGELDLQYCPANQMWADVLTKPLQGSKFRLFRAFLMNCPKDYSEDTSLPISSNIPTKPWVCKTKPSPRDNLLVWKYHHMAVILFLRRTRTWRRMSAGVTTSFHVVPPLPLILITVFLSEFKPRQSK